MVPVGSRTVSATAETPPVPGMEQPALTDVDELIERVQAAYGHACFACGRDNHAGLGLRLVGFDEGVVTAWFDPRTEHRGAPDLLHGGIAATALDEILVWAGILAERVISVTGTFDLRYRRPVGVDRPIVARGRVDERSGRRLRLSGELLVDDEVAVEGHGLYLVSMEVADLPTPGE
jgi:acyl-coenzyme A thioesterase PaaI-like protein